MILRRALRDQSMLRAIRHSSTSVDAKYAAVAKPNPKQITSDMIGPADPVSNLRPIVLKEPANESKLEEHYREKRIEVQAWNQKFWTDHNTQFFEEREQYLKENLPLGKQNLTADEMSVFYKSFLDKNWRNHVSYNIEWYKKNVNLLGLALKIKLKRLFRLKKC